MAAEKSGRGIGRIRLRRIEDVSADSLLPFVQGAVAPGSVVHTDGWSGYSGLAAAGYEHQVTVISGGRDPAHEVMPRVHTVALLLKRWLIGTHQDGIQHQQLDYYLDEFTFRFNRRRSQARGCSSTGSPNRRSPSHRRHITRSSALLGRTKSYRSVKGIPITPLCRMPRES